MTKTIRDLNLTEVPCPTNSAKAIIEIELLDIGERLSLLVKPGQTQVNLEASLEGDDRIKILSIESFEENGYVKILVEKIDE